MVADCGTSKKPRVGWYFAEPDLCSMGAVEPGSATEFWRKSLRIAATFPEIELFNKKCPGKAGNHQHVLVRGTVQVAQGVTLPRALLSAAYPLQAGCYWGQAIAKAVSRLAASTSLVVVKSACAFTTMECTMGRVMLITF